MSELPYVLKTLQLKSRRGPLYQVMSQKNRELKAMTTYNEKQKHADCFVEQRTDSRVRLV